MPAALIRNWLKCNRSTNHQVKYEHKKMDDISRNHPFFINIISTSGRVKITRFNFIFVWDKKRLNQFDSVNIKRINHKTKKKMHFILIFCF